mgnify:CR=1 FL=1
MATATTTRKAAFSDSFAEGKSTEARFESKAIEHGYAVEHASREDDMKNHFDFVLRKAGKDDEDLMLKVDVKGMKRIVRSDAFVQDDFFWVELKRSGWLFGGKADLIAFELRDNHWMLVKREKLAEFVDTFVERKAYTVDHPHNASFGVYLRESFSSSSGGYGSGGGRRRMKRITDEDLEKMEQLTLVPKKDLEEYASEVVFEVW